VGQPTKSKYLLREIYHKPRYKTSRVLVLLEITGWR